MNGGSIKVSSRSIKHIPSLICDYLNETESINYKHRTSLLLRVNQAV